MTRFEELCQAFYDHSLNDESLAQLKEELQDAGKRKQLVDDMIFDANLVENFQLLAKKKSQVLKSTITAQSFNSTHTYTSARIISWAGVAAVLLIGIFLTAQQGFLKGLLAPAIIAEASYTSGETRLFRNDNELKIHQQSQIRHGDLLVTGTSSYLMFQYEDGSTCMLGPESTLEVRVNKSTQGKWLMLQQGELQANVSPQTQSKMKLSTPEAHLEILGTEFILKSRNSQSQLDLLEGKILLSNTTGLQQMTLEGGWSTTLSNENFSEPRPIDEKLIQNQSFKGTLQDIRPKEGRLTLRSKENKTKTFFIAANKWDQTQAHKSAFLPGDQLDITYKKGTMNIIQTIQKSTRKP